jgi:hypothetical protein
MDKAEKPDYWDSTFSNNMGFSSDRDFPVAKTEKNFIVGIFGSSIAAFFALEIRRELMALINGIPGYELREVIVLDFAMGGYHQPQELLVLNYMLTLGQSFDLIINLDGPTEAFIGWDKAANFKVHPSMPNAWFVYGMQNEFVSRANNETVSILATRARMRAIERSLSTARSGLYYYVLKIMWAFNRRDAAKIETDYSKSVEGRSYPIYLVPNTENDPAEIGQEIAKVWSRSIFQTKAVADSIGARFIETLLPTSIMASASSQMKKGKSPFPIHPGTEHGACRQPMRRCGHTPQNLKDAELLLSMTVARSTIIPALSISTLAATLIIAGCPLS